MIGENSMEFDTFIKLLQDQYKKEIEEKLDGTVSFEKVKKQGIEKNALIFCPKGSCAGICQYAEDAYEAYNAGISIKQILENMIKVAEENSVIINVETPETLIGPDRICPVLIATKGNEEFLKDVPHLPFKDMQIIFKFKVDGFPSNAMGNVSYEYMTKKGWTEQQLLELAMNNTVYKEDIIIEPLESFLTGNPPLTREDDFSSLKELRFPFVCVSNRGKFYGASAILDKDVMAKLADAFQDDLNIIPESTDGCIVVPKGARSLGELQELISFVDREGVPVEQPLSDQIYCFDSHTKEITSVLREREREEHQQPTNEETPKR